MSILRLKSLRILLFLFALLLLGACSRPDFHLIDGSEVRLDDLDGRWLVVNYWAEWCKPCLDEVPELNHFYQQQQETIDLVSISFDQASNEELAAQKAKYQIEYPVIATEPAPQLAIPKPSALPANFIIAPDGTTYGPVLGPQDAKSLLELVQSYQNSWQSQP